jgi:hypothetical protein
MWISLEAAELYVTTLATVANVQADPALGPALTWDPDDDLRDPPGPSSRRRLHRQR